MEAKLMCAVPTRRLDGGPSCIDGRGGQIYHHATPGFFLESSTQFSIGVAASVLLEYEPQDISVSHLAYVLVTAKMNGVSIGVTRNDIGLNPFPPEAVADFRDYPLNQTSMLRRSHKQIAGCLVTNC